MKEVGLTHSRRPVDDHRADRQSVSFEQPGAGLVGNLVAFSREVAFERIRAVQPPGDRSQGTGQCLAAGDFRPGGGSGLTAPRYELDFGFVPQLGCNGARHDGAQLDVQPFAAQRRAGLDDEPAAIQPERPRAPKPRVETVPREFHLEVAEHRLPHCGEVTRGHR